MRRNILLALLLANTGAVTQDGEMYPEAVGGKPKPKPKPKPEQGGERLVTVDRRTTPMPKFRLGAEGVACPRCGAGVGEECDGRTLGRHWYHLARMVAAGETP